MRQFRLFMLADNAAEPHYRVADIHDEAGYRRLVLWTQSELAAARGIYEKAGFRLASRERFALDCSCSRRRVLDRGRACLPVGGFDPGRGACGATDAAVPVHAGTAERRRRARDGLRLHHLE